MIKGLLKLINQANLKTFFVKNKLFIVLKTDKILIVHWDKIYMIKAKRLNWDNENP